MGVTQTTVCLPDDLWRTVRVQAKGEGGVNALLIRALEDYLGSLHRKRGRRLPGKYQKLVTSLSRPVADLDQSACPAACLRRLGVRYTYDLVKMAPLDLRAQRNFREKSLREVQAAYSGPSRPPIPGDAGHPFR